MASSPRAVATHRLCPPAGESRAYQPRAAEQGVLYTIVRDHLETFLREAAERAEGAGLPNFVEQEFRGFLTCGILAHGFARVRCGTCALERLVPFSCKGRGFCPSCGGRRMTERAAHLVDHMLPRVPVRQWVLSLPHRLRYLLAWNHALCRAVLGVFVRAVQGFQRVPRPEPLLGVGDAEMRRRLRRRGQLHWFATSWTVSCASSKVVPRKQFFGRGKGLRSCLDKPLRMCVGSLHAFIEMRSRNQALTLRRWQVLPGLPIASS